MTAAFDMSDMPATLPAAPAVQPIYVNVTFRRAKGQCLLVIDATGLHNYLIDLEVPIVAGSFTDGPQGSATHISTSYNRVEPGALLKVGGPQEYNLLNYYTNCPSGEVMRALGESVDAAVQKIVEHYRPIEISVIIHGKGGK